MIVANDAALRLLLLPRGSCPLIGQESGRSIADGISVFRSPAGSRRYVYSIDGAIVSALQVMHGKSGGAVATNVYTAPEERRKGYAKELAHRARQDFADLAFSEERSEDGAAWANAVAPQSPPEKDPSLSGAQIDTPEFKRWFGDSKVVDSKGGPLVVYHGTGSSFDDFDRNSWFTSSPKQASGYAAMGKSGSRANLMPAFLSIRNPLVLDFDMDDPAESARAVAEGMGLPFDRIRDNNVATKAHEIVKSGIAPKAQSLGYDGVFVREAGQDTFLAFRPEQIKSVFNNGNFDPESPDIRFSRRTDQTKTPEFKRWFGNSKAVDGPLLSPALVEVCDSLRALPFADRIQVFGSAAKPGTEPKDLDVFIDLRGSADKPEQFNALLRLARTAYGLLDPFLRTDDGLLVRNAEATAWTKAKNAKKLGEAMDRDGGPLPALGKPLVVYHGSGSPNIQAFRAFKNTDGAGWFAQDPALASNFAEEGGGGRGDTVYPVYLSLKNPFDTRPYQRSGQPYPEEIRAALMTDESTAVQLSRLGFDGLIADEWGGAQGEAGTTYLAFRPEQIKSATGNNGQFDPENPDIRYSRATPSGPMPPDQVRSVVEAIRSRWANAPEIVVAADMNDTAIPQEARAFEADQKSMGQRSLVEGFFYRGKVYLIANQMGSSDDVARVLFHEALGHYGLRGVFGDSLTPILKQLVSLRRSEVAAKARQYNLDMSKPQEALIAAEEVLAVMAQSTPKIGFVKRAVATVRQFLRGLGVNLKLTENDLIANYIIPARKFVETGRAGLAQGMAAFSLRTRADPFYSDLAREIDGLNMKASIPAGWMSAVNGLVKAGKVKADEVEWSGLMDWLKMQSGKVPKESVQQYLDANGVRVEEITLGGDGQRQNYINELNRLTMDDLRSRAEGMDIDLDEIPDSRNAIIAAILEAQEGDMDFGMDRADGTAKYEKYTLPGGTNYREVLLTLPGGKEIGSYAQWLAKRLGVTPLEAQDTAEYDDDALHAQFMAEESRSKSSYHSKHWDQPNVLAHIRLNDRTDADGKRVLFVEEIQSDWGQQGKKNGFVGDVVPEIIGNRVAQVRKATGVPTAPFVTKTESWLNLALKRVMVMAAQEGYDRVAFVNGAQSAARYDLSKQVEAIYIRHHKEGKFSIGAVMPDKTLRDLAVQVDADALEGHVGKDLAKRAIEQPADGMSVRYDGPDLKVGGDGMKAFYDSIVPNAIKKLLPKLGGGQMADVDLGYFEAALMDFESAEEREAFEAKMSSNILFQPGFDITPAMREKAVEGLPMFSLESNQTQSPAFRKWFGNSKVVDANGEPLVVYHGTDAKFNTFDPEKTIGGQFWFTTDRAAIEAGEVGAQGKGRIVDAYLSIKNPAGWAEYDKLTLDELIARGYDGLALPDGEQTTYVVFDNKQIKIAKGNRGTFDPANPDIRFSLRDPSEAGFGEWFDGSLVKSPDGSPKLVYRGEHGAMANGTMQTKLGTYTFVEERSIAELYASDPNDYRMTAEQPRVLEAYLSIKNPLINNPNDPFIDLTEIAAKMGEEFALRMARKHSDHIENTGNWYENFANEYSDVDDLLKSKPDSWRDLYMDIYPLLDDREFVQAAISAGYDGAMHIGNGDSAAEMEYRVFSTDQVGLSRVTDMSGNDLKFSLRERITPDFVADNEEDREYPGSKYVEFDGGGAYAKFFADTSGNLRLTTLSTEASGKVRGRDVLRWLRDTYRMPIVVNEVDAPAAGFWDKMQAEGLIQSWDRAAYQGKTRPLAARMPVTDTPEFRRWFSDSVAVDSQGHPLVLYHGTNQDILRFDSSRLGQNTRAFSSTAFFFTETAAEASEYALMAGRTQIADAVATERKIEELQRQIQGAESVASRTQKREDWSKVESLYLALEELDLGSIQADPSGQNIIPVHISVKNPLVIDMQGGGDMDIVAQAIQRARDEGFDGVKILNVYNPVDNRTSGFTTTQWAVFRAEQIKSIFNSGRFDPNSPWLSDHRTPVTETPAFRNWFGKSQVVDSCGQPLVLYHASANEWEGDSFRRRKPASGKASLGYHVGTARAAEERIQPAIEEVYSFSWSKHSPHTIALYARIENPLRLRDIGSWHDPQWVLQALAEAKVPIQSGTLASITRQLKLMGYDGIVYQNNCEDVGSDSWIAFDPGQLKSAIGNSGVFDRNSDSLVDRIDRDEDEDENEVQHERQSYG